MKFILQLVGSLILLLLSTTVFSESSIRLKLSPEQISTQLRTLNIQQQSEMIAAMGPQELFVKADVLFLDNDSPVLEKEFLLHEISLRLGRFPQSPEATMLLKKLQGYVSQIQVVQHDGGHRQAMHAFPVAANARAIQHHWQLNQDLAKYQTANGFDSAKFIASLQRQPDQSHEELVIRAIRKITPKERKQLVAEIRSDQRLINSQDLLIIARESADTSLFKRAIQQLSDAGINNVRATYLAQLSKIWSDDQLSDLLALMLNKGVYPSLALQQMKNLKWLSGELQTQLFALFADTQLGGDAAMVIAKHMNPDLLDDLSQRLMAPDKVISRRAMLALKLSQNPSARQLLQDHFTHHPNPALEQEVMR